MDQGYSQVTRSPLKPTPTSHGNREKRYLSAADETHNTPVYAHQTTFAGDPRLFLPRLCRWGQPPSDLSTELAICHRAKGVLDGDSDGGMGDGEGVAVARATAAGLAERLGSGIGSSKGDELITRPTP